MDRTIFCTKACKDRHDALTARKAAIGAEFAERLKERVVARFGPVEFVDRDHVYVVDHPGGVLLVEEACLSFNFPGQKLGPATYRLHRPRQVRDDRCCWRDPVGPNLPELSCCYGDVAAFNAWVGEELFQVPASLKGAPHA